MKIDDFFFLKKKKNTESHGFIQIVWSLMLIFLFIYQISYYTFLQLCTFIYGLLSL